MKKNKILIVDDEPDYLDIVVSSLMDSKEPYELFQAMNGKIALEIIQEIHFDLILTDWEMPVMDGLQLVSKLQNTPETQNIPIIMMSGVMLSNTDLRSALHIGAVDYLRKPIDSIELLARVKTMLRIASANQTITEQEKELLNENIENKNRELTIAAMYLANNQKQIEKMLLEMQKLIPLTNKHGKEIIQNIVSEHKTQHQKNFMQLYEIQFREVHKDFYDNLARLHSELSSSEKRICTLLKMNLCTKDIAYLNNSSVNSIEVARSRIRKKMELDISQNLGQYIAKL